MWRDRLLVVLKLARTAFKWGWIPFILYLGIRHGGSDPALPEPNLFNAVWVL